IEAPDLCQLAQIRRCGRIRSVDDSIVLVQVDLETVGSLVRRFKTRSGKMVAGVVAMNHPPIMDDDDSCEHVSTGFIAGGSRGHELESNTVARKRIDARRLLIREGRRVLGNEYLEPPPVPTALGVGLAVDFEHEF